MSELSNTPVNLLNMFDIDPGMEESAKEITEFLMNGIEDLEKLHNLVELKFTSSNETAVSQITITRSEWEELIGKDTPEVPELIPGTMEALDKLTIFGKDGES